MNKYGKAAINSVYLITSNQVDIPKLAWDQATTNIFGKNTPSQKKGCPKNAFLGLCEEGKIKGVRNDKCTTSKKNKEYALRAIEYLSNDPTLVSNKKLLWENVTNGDKKSHNSQMDVVIALWINDLIIK